MFERSRCGGLPDVVSIVNRRMFVRTLEDARAAGLEHPISHGISIATRYVTKSDALGFSLSSASRPGRSDANELWYKNHWEANFIASGSGELEDVSNGQRWSLEPGTLYVVGPNDRHKVHAFEDLLIVCAFNHCSSVTNRTTPTGHTRRPVLYRQGWTIAACSSGRPRMLTSV